jgi:hypothetical protein
MSPIITVWPTKFVKPTARFFWGTIAFCLLSLRLFAQEPEVNTESPAITSEASSSSKPAEVPLYPSRDIRDKSLFAKEIKDEAQWLETEYGRILGLYRPTEAKKTLGVLILFHAAEDPQLWPPMLENLRANLPRYGWETLAISLPQKTPVAIPERTSSIASESASSTGIGDGDAQQSAAAEEPVAAVSSSSSDSSSAATSSIARELLITAYVNAAFNFLKEHNQLNAVVLADNSSAAQVFQALAPQIKGNKPGTTTIDGPLQALIITNLQSQEPITKPNLEAIFNSRQLPVLDIYFAPDDAGQLESRDLHRAVAMRQKVIDYQQLLIDSQPKMLENDRQSYLAGRVRGFMKQNASGIESNVRDAAEELPPE